MGSKATSYVRRRKCLTLSIPLVLVVVFVSYLHDGAKFKQFERSRQKYLRSRRPSSCKLPVLDPWDKSILEYIRTSPGSNCTKRYNFFYVDEEGILQLNRTTLSVYNVDVTLLKCVYHVVHRIDDFNISVGEGIPFTAPIFVPSRVFIVVCNNMDGKKIYRFVHLNLKWNQNNVKAHNIGFENDDKFSVIFIGIDSMSRSHALRSLPKTYKYLMERMGAFDFKGLMRVGLNTYLNLIPLLTGESHTFSDHRNGREYFDNVPFIWTEEPMTSYVVHFNEDRPDIGLFTGERLGFKDELIDYNYIHYLQTMVLIEPIILDRLGKSTKTCFGNKDHFDLQIDYFKRFMHKYSRRLKCAFFWNNQQTHDNFNGLYHADERLLELLTWLKLNGHMDRALVIVGSDHGFRLGGIATTHVGRLENNLPFMAMTIPKLLKDKYRWIHENLEYNTNRLTSAYDVYETLKQFIYMNFTRVSYPEVQQTLVRRSLFVKIPDTRTCVDAGIPDNFCSCHEAIDVDLSLPIVHDLAYTSVEHINSIIHKENKSKLCRPLELQDILRATINPTPIGDESLGNRTNSKFGKDDTRHLFGSDNFNGRYMIQFYTMPGGGLFEMMLDYKKTSSSSEVKIIGEPARINKYGNQSYCVRGHVMKQICLCYDVNVT